MVIVKIQEIWIVILMLFVFCQPLDNGLPEGTIHHRCLSVLHIIISHFTFKQHHILFILKRTLVAMSVRTGLSISQVTDEVLYKGLIGMQEMDEL